jgi:ribosomal protein L7/L12
VFVSYHRPLSDSVAAFLSCGNPNAVALPQVTLKNWRVGALTVSAIKALRLHSSLGLKAAKEVIDQCLERQPVVVSTPDVPSAHALVNALLALGFFAEVNYGG